MRQRVTLSRILVIALGVLIVGASSLWAATYQAESASLSGGAVVATDHTGYTGTGFVAGYIDANKPNAATTFSVTAASAGSYTVALRFANGTGSARTLSLFVNGGFVRQTTLGATANWDTWGVQNEVVTLNSGSNSVQYKFGAADSGNVNLDKVDVDPATTSQAESAALSGGAAVATDHTGYTGTGFVGGYVDANKPNAATTFSVSAPSAGSYTAALRYANGTGSAKTLSLFVNGGFVRQTTLGATANWDTWGTQNESVSLATSAISPGSSGSP